MVPNYPNGRPAPAGTVRTDVYNNTGHINGQPIRTIVYTISGATGTGAVSDG